MSKKYINPIINCISNTKPIGKIAFHFGPSITEGNVFKKENIEASVNLEINGYSVYKKKTLFVEIPLSGFCYSNSEIFLDASNKAIKFEKEFNEIKNSGKMKNQIVVIMTISPESETSPFIFDDVWNIRIFTRQTDYGKTKFLVFETDDISMKQFNIGPGRLHNGVSITRESIEMIFNGRNTYATKLEDEMDWAEVKKDNDNVIRYLKNKNLGGEISSAELYRYPAVLNRDYKEKHTHWPYPSDEKLKYDNYVDVFYYAINPLAKKTNRPLGIKGEILNMYADYELRKSLKKGIFDERIGYPIHIIKKYENEINQFYENKRLKEKEEVESNRAALLTEEEQKVFNQDILTFRTGAGKVTTGKLPLIPTVINDEIDKLKNKFDYLRICKEHGIYENRTENMHMCFLGNPGTGKTTVARELTQMFYDLGYIKYNECVEVNAQNIKGGYVGQTATITRAIIKHAKGRILFIDEAYALYDDYENGYGKEAVAVLLKEMEDNRNDFIVIFAGYHKEMQKFLDMNEGLRSRINRYIEFPDFTKKELCAIFSRQLANKGMYCNDAALRKFFDKIKILKKADNFSNARCVRNIVEKIIEEHAYNYMSNPVGSKYMITENDLTDEIFDEIINMSH